MIDPTTIPQFTGDEDAIERAAAALVKAARGIAQVGASVDRTWQGMTEVYEAPEAPTLFAASAPIRDRAAELGDDIEAVAQALKTYATEVRPIAEDLRFTTSIIEGLVESWRSDPEWREEDINVSEHNNLLRRVDGHLAALMAAERKAANAINALIGMPQYHQAGTEGPEEYTYGFDPAQVDPNAERPWGDPVEQEFPWWRDAWNETYAFGKGVAWEGAVQGDLRGLLNIAGFWGQDGSVWSFGTLRDTWVGAAKLAVLSMPGVLQLNQMTALPGLRKGEGGEILMSMGKGLVAWDKWGKGKDNSQAAGEAVYNVVSVASIFTKVGTAGKAASGAADAAHVVDEVAEAGSDAARAGHSAEAARAAESMRTAEPITDLSRVVAPADRALPNLRGILETTRAYPWAERSLRWNISDSGLGPRAAGQGMRPSALPMETLPEELRQPREARPTTPDAEPPDTLAARTAPPRTQLDSLFEKLDDLEARERVREPAMAGARQEPPRASGSGDTPHLSTADDSAKTSEATPGQGRGSGEGGGGEGGSPARHADDADHSRSSPEGPKARPMNSSTQPDEPSTLDLDPRPDTPLHDTGAEPHLDADATPAPKIDTERSGNFEFTGRPSEHPGLDPWLAAEFPDVESILRSDSDDLAAREIPESATEGIGERIPINNGTEVIGNKRLGQTLGALQERFGSKVRHPEIPKYDHERLTARRLAAEGLDITFRDEIHGRVDGKKNPDIVARTGPSDPGILGDLKRTTSNDPGRKAESIVRATFKKDPDLRLISIDGREVGMTWQQAANTVNRLVKAYGPALPQHWRIVFLTADNTSVWWNPKMERFVYVRK